MDDQDTTDRDEGTGTESAAPAAQWKPLSAKQRRVLGTLMEKSKTTPDAYPMTFASLTTACNQKTNRAPISNYSNEQVEAIVDELRTLGAVAIVQGVGRVTKVRHYGYNWLNLNKTEAAVMAELLLRGEQTLGELRTRASRMEPFDSLEQLSDVFNELKKKNLVVELTPPGRGQMVSHNLYPEWELEQLQKSVLTRSVGTDTNDESVGQGRSSGSSVASSTPKLAELESEVQQLKATVLDLQARLEKLEKDLGV